MTVIDELIKLYYLAERHGQCPDKCYVPAHRMPELCKEFDKRIGELWNPGGFRHDMYIRDMCILPTNSHSIWVSE